MSKKKEYRAKIDAWKKKEEAEWLKSLPFAESIFQELFDHLDLQLANQPCQNNYKLTTAFLATKGIDFKAHIDFFIEHGGGCDCEVLMNIEGLFPEQELPPTDPRPSPPKREKVNAIAYEGLIIESIPAPWKLYRIAEDYEFQLGKQQRVKMSLLRQFSVADWQDQAYWQREWERITELKVRGNKEVVFEELAGFQRATFKTQDWTPVLTWLRKDERSTWGLLFRTELSRFRGDINAVKNLLKRISPPT